RSHISNHFVGSTADDVLRQREEECSVPAADDVHADILEVRGPNGELQRNRRSDKRMGTVRGWTVIHEQHHIRSNAVHGVYR
ncbi:hypothetical protein PMAYCL1PPCAC_21759, partial [Pristionchus mayeri]